MADESIVHIKHQHSSLRLIFCICSLSTGRFYSLLRIFVVNSLKQVVLHTGAAAIYFSSIFFSFNVVVKVFVLLHFI